MQGQKTNELKVNYNSFHQKSKAAIFHQRYLRKKHKRFLKNTLTVTG